MKPIRMDEPDDEEFHTPDTCNICRALQEEELAEGRKWLKDWEDSRNPPSEESK